MKIFLNGKFVSREEAKISVFDHGLLYGDGVFEGIRVYGGMPFRLSEHVERLYKSAKAIMLEAPFARDEMENLIMKTSEMNDIKEGYIRVVVTRGEGDLGLDPVKCPSPSVFIIADEISLYPEQLYEKGIEIVTVPVQRTSPTMLEPRIKSLNYLNNIMAKLHANNAGKPEALMINSDGYIVECSGENIFIVEGKNLFTPPAHLGILEGITRAAVMEIAPSCGCRVSEECLTLYDVYNADECFLTGSAAEIVPVVEVDGRKISSGLPGKETGQLIKKFRELTRRA